MEQGVNLHILHCCMYMNNKSLNIVISGPIQKCISSSHMGFFISVCVKDLKMRTLKRRINILKMND